jgi:hypothetical protein
MLPGPGELTLGDPALLADLTAWIDAHRGSPAASPPPTVEFSVALAAAGGLTVHVRFPRLYPSCGVVPELTLAAARVPRAVLASLAAEAVAHASAGMGGDCCTWPALAWLADAATAAGSVLANPPAATPVPPPAPSSRAPEGYRLEALWFHHIYNAAKRRTIADVAGELAVTGFCMPGKPGVVVAEGAAASVGEFCRRIRRLPWQHVASRYVEDDTAAASATDKRRFSGFTGAQVLFVPVLAG